MSVLDHFAQAAAALLLLELFVLVLIFVAISGGLAFGLRWVRGRTGWAFEKANSYLAMAARYLHTGTDYAARPFIQVSGLAESVKGTAAAIRRRVQQVQAATLEAPPAATTGEAEPAEAESVAPLT